MNPSPELPANYSRLKLSQDDMARRKQEALDGVLAALNAHSEGNYHPRLLTPHRRAEMYETQRLKTVARDTAFFPRLPQIIVTKPVEEWHDFTTERHGLYGAILQE